MDDDPIDRSLIEAARDGLGPTDADRARVRRAVRAAIAGGAAATASAAATTASAAANGAVGAWTLAKVIAVSASVLTIAAGTTWGVMEASEPEPPRVATAARVAEVRETAPAVAQERVAVTEAAPEQAPPAEVEVIEPVREAATREPARAERARDAAARPVAPRVLEPRSVGGASSPEASPPPRVALAAPSAQEALTAETALLRDAHRALHAHDPASALAILDRHASQFPSGVLSEERSATRVLALCDAGQVDQARAEASRFLAAHPRSMHAARVRASACAP